MKITYPVRLDPTAKPPKKRVGAVPRWQPVTEKLMDLVRQGGVLNVSVPRAQIPKEIRSLRNSISRWRKANGVSHRFHVHIDDTGIAIWPFTEEEMAEDEARRNHEEANHHG